MGELADRLNRLTIRASSPDRRIAVAVSGHGELVGIELSAAAFHSYHERTLAHQLEQLGKLVHVTYRREYRALTDAVFERPIYDDMIDEVGPQLREYRERVAAIVSHGQGGEDRVRISACGLLTWEVTVSGGVTRQVPVDVFLEWLDTALSGLRADHYAQVRQIRREVYEGEQPPGRQEPGGGADRVRHQRVRSAYQPAAAVGTSNRLSGLRRRIPER
jgi:hypothetical protein